MTSRDQVRAVRLLYLLNELEGSEQSASSATERARRGTAHLERLIAGGSGHRWRELWQHAFVPATVAAIGLVAVILIWTNGAARIRSKQANRAAPIVAYIRELHGNVGISSQSARAIPARAGQALIAGSNVDIGSDSAVAMELPSGAHVEARTRSAIGLGQPAPKREELLLESGAVTLRVPRLPHGNSLAVVTENARVTVFGTSFEVEVERLETGAGHGIRTCVAVSEGGVLVDHAAQRLRVAAGERWSSDGRQCFERLDMPLPGAMGAIEPASLPARQTVQQSKPLRDMPPTASNAGLPSDVAVSRGSTHADTTSNASAPLLGDVTAGAVAHEIEIDARSSTLAKQNALFAQAVAARRRGDAKLALRLFEQLLLDFPNSPLAPQARRECAALGALPQH